MKVTELLKKLRDSYDDDYDLTLCYDGSGRIESYYSGVLVSWENEDEMNEKLNSLWANINNPNKWEI